MRLLWAILRSLPKLAALVTLVAFAASTACGSIVADDAASVAPQPTELELTAELRALIRAEVAVGLRDVSLVLSDPAET